MAELTSRQRAILKSIAHSLKAEQHIGKDGITDALVRSVGEALNNRELLKVRVLETARAPVRELADALAGGIADTHVVQVIGRTIVLYRRHPEEPQITLPSR